MILEVDCGNTLIKWRFIDKLNHQISHSGAADALNPFLEQLANLPVAPLTMIRAVSVRGDDETQALSRALQQLYSLPVRLANSAPRLCSVTNGYIQPQLLGVDRWLAVVAAYELTRCACLVLDLGTAVTSDFVSGAGAHMGGYICPGVRLMREQLERHARRINFQPGMHSDCWIPGKSTSQAVESGTQLMLLGFVDTQIKLAGELLGEKYRVVITGGDAALIANSLPDAMVEVDLVFRGLSLAFPD